jgi:membrane protein implicated in regulation of membrane protease activity
VPTTAGRRIGIVVVLLLLAGAGALATLPRGAGATRVGSLSLLWWYAGVVAPAAAAAVTATVLGRRRPAESPASPSAPPK